MSLFNCLLLAIIIILIWDDIRLRRTIYKIGKTLQEILEKE